MNSKELLNSREKVGTSRQENHKKKISSNKCLHKILLMSTSGHMIALINSELAAKVSQ